VFFSVDQIYGHESSQRGLNAFHGGRHRVAVTALIQFSKENAWSLQIPLERHE
jgi:hypothetical protein